MSGGHFDYAQFRINEIIESVEDIIKHNKVPSEENYTRYNYSEDTIQVFRQGLVNLLLARIYSQRIDWLVSGDDSEVDFHERLSEEFEKSKGVILELLKGERNDTGGL